jgi:hypothetical protein
LEFIRVQGKFDEIYQNPGGALAEGFCRGLAISFDNNERLSDKGANKPMGG